ncbi:MAG: hypothetical protein LBP76_09580 [Treponema sp.]|nr:hypothetical protein [Treponema sp.]
MSDNTVEEIKRFVLDDNAIFTIGQYRYRIRFPRCAGRKGLYFVTVLVSDKWRYVGHFWRSSLTLSRGVKSEFSWDDGPVAIFDKFLTGLKYGKLPDQMDVTRDVS